MENVSGDYDRLNGVGGDLIQHSTKTARYAARCIVNLLASVHQYEQGHTTVLPGWWDSLQSTGGTTRYVAHGDRYEARRGRSVSEPYHEKQEQRSVAPYENISGQLIGRTALRS